MKELLRKDLPAILLLIVFGTFLAAPFLFFGKAFAGEEHMGFYYAISFWVHESIAHGSSLLWQSAYYGGVSASLDQFVGAWYPINVFLFSHFPFFIAHHLSIFFATTLGLLLSYWFGRVQKWGRAAAVLFALSYLLATSFQWLAIGTIAAHSFMILPGLMLSLWYLAYRGKTPFTIGLFIVWGGIALGVGFLSGFAQIIFYNACIAGAYALYLDWNRYTKGFGFFTSLKTSISYAGMSVLGLFIGVWQFFPSAALIGLTIRTGDYAQQTFGYPTPFELITFFLPPYKEIPFLLSGGVSAGFFIGAIGLLFVLMSVIHYRTHGVIFFGGLYVLICLFAFHIPPFGWLNDHIPPFSHMGGNFRWLTVAAFPLAYLAAAGADGFLHKADRISSRSLQRYIWLSGAISALMILGSIFLYALIHAILRSPETINSIIAFYGHYHTLSASTETYRTVLTTSLQKIGAIFSLTSAHYLFSVGIWVLACAGLFVYQRYVRMRRYAPHVIVIVTVLTAGVSFMFPWSQLTSQSLFTEIPPLASTITARESDPNTYRVMGFVIGDGIFNKRLSHKPLTPDENTRLQLQLLIDNSNIYWGIERIDGLEPYRTLRSNQLLNTVVAYDTASYAFDDKTFSSTLPVLNKLYNRSVQKSVYLEEKIEDLKMRMSLVSMLNVKYIYSLYPLTDPTFKQIPIKEVQAGSEVLPLYLYENKKVLPRIYFAKALIFATGTDSQVLERVVTVKDFKETTVIECANCEPQRSVGAVTVHQYQSGNVQVTTHSDTGGYLVFSESALPGWVATIDGIQTQIYTANYLFQAIYVGPGEHAVGFVYHDVTMLKLGSLFTHI